MNPASPLDWPIYEDIFCSADMRNIFCQRGAIQRWIDVEMSVAKVQGRLGIIPVESADTIQNRATMDRLDFHQLRLDTLDVGRPIVGLARQLGEQVGSPHSEWVHYGITTYDVLDSGTALQVRDGLDLLGTRLKVLRKTLESLSTKHRCTVMVGRTSGQHAQPTTFGAKLASWLEEMLRHESRLAAAGGRAATIQMGGVVGTLASVHPHGLTMRREVAESLGLGHATTNWYNSRDSFTEVGQVLGLLGASLARNARDIAGLASTELGEVYERGDEDRGRSSGMPHKRNPISAEFAESTARLLRHRSGGLIEAMGQEHERSGGTYIAEWVLLPEVFALASAAVDWSIDLFERLEVDHQAMENNIAMTHGLILSERFTLELARHMPKSEARELMDVACAKARKEKQSLVNVLTKITAVNDVFTFEELEVLAEPAGYLGAAGQMVDNAVCLSRSTDALKIIPSQPTRYQRLTES